MTTNESLEIIMKTGSTLKEAQKHLANGTFIYPEEDKDWYIDDLMKNGFSYTEASEMWTDLYIVRHNGVVYHIDFTL